MSTEPSPASAAARRAAPGHGRARAVQMMVLGSVLAVLGPLGGFLAGSMIGLSRRLGEYDAMFVAMFAGLVIGGVGAIIAGLGLLRYARRDAQTPPPQARQDAVRKASGDARR
jgi:hypothetical protein